MVTIATFTTPQDAHLLRMHLEACGITAYLQDENLVQMDLLISNAVGGVRVQVADEDVAEARAILLNDKGVSDEADTVKCPKCGSTAVENERFSRRLALVTFIFLGFPLLFFRRKLRCSSCLHTWKAQ
jgi:hypothetical protein